MKFNLTKEEMHDHLKVKKAALISIAINVLEIVAGIVMLTLVRRMLLGGVEESIVRMVSLLCFTIVADAFARNMVRSLVGGCIQVGMGKRSTDWFREKMAVPLREGSTGPIAPQGLTLEHVAYPADDELAERAERIRAKRTL